MEYISDDINDLLIHYVRSRPELWDCKNTKYKDNFLKRKLWCEVAKELNVTDEFVKNRWRNLRDKYMKEKKKLKTKSGQAASNFSPWPYISSFSFMEHLMEPRETVTNLQSFRNDPPLSIDLNTYQTQEQLNTYQTQEQLDTYQTQEQLDTYQMQEDVDNMHDTQEFQETNIRDHNVIQTAQTTFCSRRPLSVLSHSYSTSSRPPSSSSHSYSASPRPPSSSSHSYSASPRRLSSSSHSPSISPRPSSALANPPIISPRPSSASADSPSISSCSQTESAKQAKRSNSRTSSIDAVDEAILQMVQKRTMVDALNADDLFFLSISQSSQKLNESAKLRLKTLVLQAVSTVMAEEQNKN